PEYFQQLTAEVLVRRHIKSGRLAHEWIKKRERNEALDCRTYARAAAYMLGIDRWGPEDWANARRAVAARVAPKTAPPPPPPPPKTHEDPPPPGQKPHEARPPREQRGSGPSSRWRGPRTT